MRFQMNRSGSLVVHWDGKVLPDVVGKTKVDRIAVLVSYNGTSKFLGAPKITDSPTGERIAHAVYKILTDWNIADKVTAMSFDTTSTNTGINIGACVILQKLLGRELIWLACRHHFYEVVLGSVFEIKLGSSSAPEVAMFERFAKDWSKIDKTSFKSGLQDDVVRLHISDKEQMDIEKFCNTQLTKNQSREDYKEFLQLTLIFVGGIGFNFHTPGATSNARWMSKAIYSLKMFVFRDQFTLSKKQLNGLRDVCLFLVKIYVNAWFGCTNAISAPRQDLSFVKESIEYVKTDPSVSKEVLRKMMNHLWFLSEELVALAFFDPDVSFEEKRSMVKRLKSEDANVKLRNGRTHSKLNDFHQYNLNDFVSAKTMLFFKRFNLSSEFLDFDSSTWETKFDFEEGWSFCKDLFVTNDTAERGVKFMKDYNRILTNDEEGKQMLLQIVEAYRKKFPSFRKSSLI